MNIIEVMRLPLSVDLSGFVHLLQRLQVPHRVSEEGDAQVLWAPTPWPKMCCSSTSATPTATPTCRPPLTL